MFCARARSADLNNIGAWLNWLQWLSIFKYSYQAVMINQLDGMVFVCDPSEYITIGTVTICPITSGNQILTRLGLDDHGIWFPLVMLFALMVLFRVIGLIFLYWQTYRVLKRN